MRIDNNRNLQTSSYWRCLRVALSLFLIQLLAVNHLMAQDKLLVPKMTIVPGTTQKLAVQLENSVAYTAFEAKFYFPEGVAPVKKGDGVYNVSLSDSRKANHSISANLVSDGALKVIAYSMGNQSLKGSSGDLFYIDIVTESSFVGSATVEVKNILFDRVSDRKEIEFAETNGYLDTRTILRGDVNNDTKVTITDAVGVVNRILGSPSGGFNAAAADVNEDGRITITDAVGVVNIILNSGAGAPAMDIKEPVDPE